MKSHERTVLMLLFSANVLATSILIAGLAGIWFTGDPVTFPDYTWLETIYIIMQNLETLAYTIGASAPGKQASFVIYLSLLRKELINPAVLYRSIVGKPGSRGSSDRARAWRLHDYKDSGNSGGTTLTNNTAPSAYQTGRKGSMFKPAPIDPSTAQDAWKGEDIMASPTSPHLYHDKAQLNAGWKPSTGGL